MYNHVTKILLVIIMKVPMVCPLIRIKFRGKLMSND